MILRHILRPLAPRSIFAKLATVFLVIGLVPFLGMELFTYKEAEDRMTEAVIEYWLVRLARETAAQLDQEVLHMRDLTTAWTEDEFLARGIEAALGRDGDGTTTACPDLLRYLHSQHKTRRHGVDYLGLVARDGRILADSLYEPRTGSFVAPLAGSRLQDVLPREEDRTWITETFDRRRDRGAEDEPHLSARSWHVSRLLAAARGRPPPEGTPNVPDAYHLGFAGTVTGSTGAPRAAVLALFRWTRIQGILDRVSQRFSTRDDPRQPGARYGTGYPFLFAEDKDTIIGHENRQLLGNSLVGDHGLDGFRRRMLEAEYGSVQYEYPPGTPKITGFARAAGPERNGFGWAVGVGINDQEIYADVWQLGEVLLIAALIVTGLVVLGAAVFSHRITDPITRLIRYTEKVARGNLEERVDIRTNDEIAVLADSFNRMVDDLKESNRRLIQAEKNAAWQEMARQVAHEIKNPLTPIKLSAQQIQRAHKDRHPTFDEILQESVDSIIAQCESLQRIATDFAKFSAFKSRNKEIVEVEELVDSAVSLFRARASDAGVQVGLDLRVPPGTSVLVDRDDFQRVLINLFTNALEAMAPHGGRLNVSADFYRLEERRRVRIAVRDTGKGIPQKDQRRLFEPYFSTRTGGTGLGLALCEKIVQEHGGRMELHSEVGQGTTMVIHLPVVHIPGTAGTARGEGGESPPPHRPGASPPRPTSS